MHLIVVWGNQTKQNQRGLLPGATKAQHTKPDQTILLSGVEEKSCLGKRENYYFISSYYAKDASIKSHATSMSIDMFSYYQHTFDFDCC